jgi:hypothetical protein
MPSSWIEEYEKSKSSKYLKHLSGIPIEVTFLSNDPEVKEFSKDEKQIKCYEWRGKTVDESGSRETIESVTSSRLVKLIIAEAKKAPLTGRTFTITAIGDGLQRMWTMTEAKRT